MAEPAACCGRPDGDADCSPCVPTSATKHGFTYEFVPELSGGPGWRVRCTCGWSRYRVWRTHARADAAAHVDLGQGHPHNPWSHACRKNIPGEPTCGQAYCPTCEHVG